MPCRCLWVCSRNLRLEGGSPDLIRLVRLHSLVMFLVFQQWLFTEVFDKEKMLENFLNSNEQNLGLVMRDVSVLGLAMCALN